MRDSGLSFCFMRPQHQPSLWFPCFSVSNDNMLNCTILRCERQNRSLVSLTDMMRRGKWFCLFFPDSFMLLLEWKPLHEATSGQTNIYSSGIIKQTNTGGEENIWVLNTHPGVLQSWTWKQGFFCLQSWELEPQQCASNWLLLKLIAPIYFQKLEIYWCYYLYFQT